MRPLERDETLARGTRETPNRLVNGKFGAAGPVDGRDRNARAWHSTRSSANGHRGDNGPHACNSHLCRLTRRFVVFAARRLMFSSHHGEQQGPRDELLWKCECGCSAVVAHHLAKVRVAGSNPVIRSRGRLGTSSMPSSFARWSGRVVRQRPAKPCTRVRFPSPPRAISSAGERFPDTEEVTGSIPVSRTTSQAPFRGGLTCLRRGPVSPARGRPCRAVGGRATR